MGRRWRGGQKGGEKMGRGNVWGENFKGGERGAGGMERGSRTTGLKEWRKRGVLSLKGDKIGGLRAFLGFQYRVSAKRVLVGELDENGVIWCNGVISEENQGFRAIRSITGGGKV